MENYLFNIEIAAHPFKIVGNTATLATILKTLSTLSGDDFDEGITEVTMICSDADRVLKVKAVIHKDDNVFYYKRMENNSLWCYEETHPIDAFMVELLENSSFTHKNFQDNREGFYYLRYLTDVACEFYRMTFDSRLIQRKYTGSRKYKSSKVIIDNQTKIEADILYKGWSMLQRFAIITNELDKQDSIVEAFRILMLEGLLFMPTLSINPDKNLTKTKVITKIQNENKLLKGRDLSCLPFPKKSFSHSFIKNVMELSNNDPDFHKDYYIPLIKVREQLPACLLKGSNNIKLFGKHIKPEHRGRPCGKKKPVTPSQ